MLEEAPARGEEPGSMLLQLLQPTGTRLLRSALGCGEGGRGGWRQHEPQCRAQRVWNAPILHALEEVAGERGCQRRGAFPCIFRVLHFAY